MEKVIAQGAEAKIIQKGNFIVKARTKKSYRLPILDERIRNRRTRKEKTLIEKASKVVNVPEIINVIDDNIGGYDFNTSIKMRFIKGKKLSENLDSFNLNKQKQICKIIGKDISKLHDADIIHGDLTTSNMILDDEKNEPKLNNFEKQLSEIKKLNMPRDEYAIFGSGPLAIREIRDVEDLDIIVKKSLWDKLIKKYPQENEKLIKIGTINIYQDWLPWLNNTNKIIEDADIFDNIRFVKLKYVIKWKKKYGRQKDKKDIQVIKDYQSKNKSVSKANLSFGREGGKELIIFFIDFGLGFGSHHFEDKAVDLHLLKQALEAKHFKHWQILWQEIEKGYKNSKNTKESKQVLERLKAVEKRGRYKEKY